MEAETISEALARLRTGEIGEKIIYFYVTDDAGKLLGVVPTRRLLLAAPRATIGSIMVRSVISISKDATLREALEAITEHRLLAIPVVDEQGRLTGVVDLGQYAPQAQDFGRRETADELFQLVGIHIEQERRFRAIEAVRSRFPWLLWNICSGLIAALITGAFAELLEIAVALAFFVPVVLALGESISMQSVTIGLQRLHLPPDAFPPGMANREVRVGVALGLASGVIVALVALVWLGQPAIAGILLASLMIAGLFGTALGFFIPQLVHRWELDPKIASGPAVLALSDVLVLSFYLGLSYFVLG
jgi:magnesium transporter